MAATRHNTSLRTPDTGRPATTLPSQHLCPECVCERSTVIANSQIAKKHAKWKDNCVSNGDGDGPRHDANAGDGQVQPEVRPLCTNYVTTWPSPCTRRDENLTRFSRQFPTDERGETRPLCPSINVVDSVRHPRRCLPRGNSLSTDERTARNATRSHFAALKRRLLRSRKTHDREAYTT